VALFLKNQQLQWVKNVGTVPALLLAQEQQDAPLTAHNNNKMAEAREPIILELLRVPKVICSLPTPWWGVLTIDDVDVRQQKQEDNDVPG